MRLLILGGTVFLGRHGVAAALALGHQVTLFHRGQHGLDLFPECERVLGDRDQGLASLRGRTWDAVIDTSGYQPSVVRSGAEALAPAVGRYAFVSTISAYADLSRPHMDEKAPLHQPLAGGEVTDATYGPQKAGCEHAVTKAFGERAFIVRPGLIVGPHDPTDCLLFWMRHVASATTILGPGAPDRPLQVIDARDLAEWIVHGLEQGLQGPFHAVGPEQPLGFGEMLDACRAVTGTDAPYAWMDDGFMVAHGITGWSELPLWLPRRPAGALTWALPRADGMQGLMSMDGGRAWNAGLRCRPLQETLADKRGWNRDRG